MGAEASHTAGAYEEPSLPAGVFEVRVSVYKLQLTGVGFLDRIGASLAGTYHTGLVVCGEEYAFGGHDDPSQTGVYTTRPEMNTDYMFYQRIVSGRLEMAISKVKRIVDELAASPQWLGTAYNLTERNCNHFASDLCWALLRTRPPEWINKTAENICLDSKRRRCEHAALTKAMVKYRATYRDWVGETAMEPQEPKPMGGSRTDEDLPGGKIFEDTFSMTFELVWKRRYGEIAKSRNTCPMDVDPVVHRKALEDRTIEQAIKAAEAAAEVVARAAREAQEVRQLVEPVLPGDALAAWDLAWANRSAALLRSWREDATQGVLDPDPDSEQGRQRDEQVRRALDEAKEAAQDAWDPQKRSHEDDPNSAQSECERREFRHLVPTQGRLDTEALPRGAACNVAIAQSMPFGS